METNSILTQLRTLKKSGENSKVFNVIPLPEKPHKLGVSGEGYPMFFISTSGSDILSQNIVREILTVEYNLPCTIVEDEVTEQTDRFSIISLRTLQESLQAYFVDIIVMMLQRIPQRPSKRELSIEVENLIMIFSALSKPPRKEIQGLWAELLVIEKSKSPQSLIKAWHNSPDAKYDFTMGKDKLEVKSTSSENRVHHFSLDQLNPSQNSKLIIASVIVRESGPCLDGLSVNNLYNRVCMRIPAMEDRLMLYTKIVESIGDNFSKLGNTYFDYIGASDSLAFYNAHDIPRVDRENIPPHVSNVKFNSDLSHLADIRNTNLTLEINSSLLQSIL